LCLWKEGKSSNVITWKGGGDGRKEGNGREGKRGGKEGEAKKIKSGRTIKEERKEGRNKGRNESLSINEVKYGRSTVKLEEVIDFGRGPLAQFVLVSGSIRVNVRPSKGVKKVRRRDIWEALSRRVEVDEKIERDILDLLLKGS
jgi:hypothetical protein